MVARPLALAVGAVAVERRRRPGPGPGSGVDGVDPEARDPGPAEPGRQHVDRRVVGVQHRARHDVGADQLGQRCQPPGGMADPIGQGDAVDVDALARQDRRLAIERQAVAVLRDHDVGDQARTGPALLDRQVGCRRLEDPLAAPAGVLRPDVADDLVPGRDLLQHLGDVLAHPDQPADRCSHRGSRARGRRSRAADAPAAACAGPVAVAGPRIADGPAGRRRARLRLPRGPRAAARAGRSPDRASPTSGRSGPAAAPRAGPADARSRSPPGRAWRGPSPARRRARPPSAAARRARRRELAGRFPCAREYATRPPSPRQAAGRTRCRVTMSQPNQRLRQHAAAGRPSTPACASRSPRSASTAAPRSA